LVKIEIDDSSLSLFFFNSKFLFAFQDGTADVLLNIRDIEICAYTIEISLTRNINYIHIWKTIIWKYIYIIYKVKKFISIIYTLLSEFLPIA